MAPSPRRSAARTIKRGRGRPRLPENVGVGPTPRNRNSNRRRISSSYATPRPRPRNRSQNYTSGRRRNGNSQNADGGAVYKPREEKSYQEIHPDLDVEAALPIFEAEAVDEWGEEDGVAGDGSGVAEGQPPESPLKSLSSLHRPLSLSIGTAVPSIVEPGTANSLNTPTDSGMHEDLPVSPAPDSAVSASGSAVPVNPPATPGELTVDIDQMTPSRPSARRNRSSRDSRRSLAALRTPKAEPAPPKEMLDLPKASYRLLTVPDFGTGAFARKSVERNSENEGEGAEKEERALSRLEVRDKMVKSGYQMTNVWQRPKHLLRDDGNYYEEDDVGVGVGTATSLKAEYDMDEQDDRWLADLNELRTSMDLPAIPHEVFELAMTMIEREWCALERRIPRKQPKNSQTHLSSITPSRHLSSGWGPDEMGDGDGEGEDTKCNICDDGECENSNAIVFCDGCDLAVHQDCYGIPHIPEGQYHCRKCMFAPSQVVHCVLCPNTDGAFKQTSNNGWAHLLCAMWIPELSLGNPVYMEPVDGLDKIPKSRWKLSCYICKQRMGACIQCSNKTCYVAFHVTCARKAKLFLKMTKNPNGSPPFDPSTLRALCHRHVPADWRREQNSDEVFEETVEYFRTNFAGVQWDSNPNRAFMIGPGIRNEHMMTPMIGLSPKKGTPSPSKRKRSSPKKPPWKLPSGAPVIPQIIFNEVVESLRPVRLKDCEDYVADLCKYWALKREARRGAPLIKRFQSQMDTFSSMEVTRKNYATLQQGREKLERRTHFAEIVLQDMKKLKELTDNIEKREETKGSLGDMLDKFVTEVYMPEIELMWPIFEEAVSLDADCEFRIGFSVIKSRIEDALYTSVDTFYQDLHQMLISHPKAPDFAVLVPDGLPVSQDSYPPRITAVISPSESSEPHPIATKILDHIKPLVVQAKRAEAEIDYNPLNQTPAQIQKHWEQFDKTVGMSLGTMAELPMEITSSLANGVPDRAPQSPSASVHSAYHTPPTFPGTSSRPPLMWENGKPPWFVAGFEPRGLEFQEEEGAIDEPMVGGESTPLSELPDGRVNGIEKPTEKTEPPPLSNGVSPQKSQTLSSLPLSPPSAPPSEPKEQSNLSQRSQLPSPAITAVNNSSPAEAAAEEDDSPLSSPIDTPSPKRAEEVVETTILSPSKNQQRSPMTPRRASARVKAAMT